MSEGFRTVEQVQSDPYVQEIVKAVLHMDLVQVMVLARIAAGSALGADGIRRFIKAGVLRNKAAFLHDEADDEGSEQEALLELADKETFLGASETMSAAGLLGSYHYMLTEAVLLTTSALKFFERKSSVLQTPLAQRIRSVVPYAELIHSLFEIRVQQLFVSLGATCLGTAFAMEVDNPEAEASYQKRSVMGGTLYAIGAAIDLAMNPASIKDSLVNGWMVYLNGSFSFSAWRNLQGGNQARALSIDGGDANAPLTEQGTFDLAKFERKSDTVDRAIARMTKGERLQGQDLTRRIMAIRFGKDAIGQVVPLQDQEDPGAIPAGCQRVVGATGIVRIMPKDPYTGEIGAFPPEAEPADLQAAFDGLLTLPLALDKMVEEVADAAGIERPLSPEVRNLIISALAESANAK